MTRINKEVDGLDNALKNALRRQQAPEGFADRVLTRVANQGATQNPTRDSWLTLFAQPLVRWAALAAIATAMILGFVHVQNVRRERAEGEAAKQRLILALRIAGSKLQLAKAKVNEINANQSRNKQVKE
ncbi:MAG TPA: hypothetical protein VFE61_23535 [Candidatus Sulfotelmatobacter sp.]|nr:hypothetical protein [Candidatus Sulfotelmatobacter sp.]